jgi:hypothetical protein
LRSSSTGFSRAVPIASPEPCFFFRIEGRARSRAVKSLPGAEPGDGAAVMVERGFAQPAARGVDNFFPMRPVRLRGRTDAMDTSRLRSSEDLHPGSDGQGGIWKNPGHRRRKNLRNNPMQRRSAGEARGCAKREQKNSEE